MLSVMINGQERRELIDLPSLSIENKLMAEVDTCSFTLETTDRSQAPQLGQEVIIAEGVERIFGGRIVRTPETEFLPGHFSYLAQVIDYACELDQKLFKESYENMTAGAIIRDLLTKYAPTITAANVKDGPNIQKIRFNYESSSACIKRLCDIAGFDWYVDYNRGLHFFDRETYAAPFSLTEEGGNYSDLSIEPDLSQVRNRVFVRGGVYASDPFTQTFKGDGNNRAWTLAYKPHPISATTPITVTLNGVTKTLGIENLDDPATKDFLLNYSEKVIKAGTNLATPTSTDTIAVTYRYEVPVLVQVDDPSSQQSLAAITGGDGIYEHLIQDENIKTKELAWQVGQAEMAQFSNPKVTASFSTFTSGLRAGMLISVQIARRGIDRTFLITSVNKKPKFYEETTGFRWEYSISCETKLLGIEALLIELLDKSRAVVDREDEIVHRLFNVTGDNIQATEIFTVTQGAPVSLIGSALVGYSEVA